MTKMIPITEAMPDPGVLVSVYSQQDNLYGYARWSVKKKFGSTVGKWTFDEQQNIEYSPISHWWPIPEQPDEK